MPVPGHVGSDYDRLRPDFRVIDNPFDPRQRILLVPAIRPDLSLIHALAAAADGTLLLDHMEDDALLAQASRVVIASAERIVPVAELRRAAEGVVLEGIHVAGVVELPGGAHPTLARGVYEVDAKHLEEYARAARDDAGFAGYLARHGYGREES
jgi:glutaconate CoA-transferase subunit A